VEQKLSQDIAGVCLYGLCRLERTLWSGVLGLVIRLSHNRCRAAADKRGVLKVELGDLLVALKATVDENRGH
jgi:hypothetical protein